MEKIDKIIELIREMMVANPIGSSGGFSSKSSSAGPVAGRDKFVGKNNKIDYRRVPPSYKKWVKDVHNNKNNK
jgi:hypothetical protein